MFNLINRHGVSYKIGIVLYKIGKVYVYTIDNSVTVYLFPINQK